MSLPEELVVEEAESLLQQHGEHHPKYQEPLLQWDIPGVTGFNSDEPDEGGEQQRHQPEESPVRETAPAGTGAMLGPVLAPCLRPSAPHLHPSVLVLALGAMPRSYQYQHQSGTSAEPSVVPILVLLLHLHSSSTGKQNWHQCPHCAHISTSTGLTSMLVPVPARHRTDSTVVLVPAPLLHTCTTILGYYQHCLGTGTSAPMFSHHH